MTAQDRLHSLRTMQADMLCASAETALSALVEIMNRETTYLRAGDYKAAAALSSEKAQIAQDYVVLARAVQDQAPRLKAEAPQALAGLQAGHERLATQMAENMRVLATARHVTHALLNDVAKAAGAQTQTSGYAANGTAGNANTLQGKGLAVNRAL